MKEEKRLSEYGYLLLFIIGACASCLSMGCAVVGIILNSLTIIRISAILGTVAFVQFCSVAVCWYLSVKRHKRV